MGHPLLPPKDKNPTHALNHPSEQELLAGDPGITRMNGAPGGRVLPHSIPHPATMKPRRGWGTRSRREEGAPDFDGLGTRFGD